MGWLALATILISGWWIADVLTPGSRWRTAALTVLIGPGMASLGAMPLALAGANHRIGAWSWIVSLAAASWLVRRRFRTRPGIGERSGLTADNPWWLWLALAVASILFVWRIAPGVASLPQGEWDAIAFWNSRAAQIAGGSEGWQQLLHKRVGGFPTDNVHPSYPLFLSGWVGLVWLAGEQEQAIPLAISWLAPAATLRLLGSSIRARRSTGLALLACLMLMTNVAYAHQVSFQYSDLWLALAVLAMVIMLDRALRNEGGARAWLALGLIAGLSVWIKNEGWPAAIATLASVWWMRGGRTLLVTLAGAAPGLASALLLKLLSDGVEWFIPRTAGGVVSRVLDVTRWETIASEVLRTLGEWGPWWRHPLLLLAALACVLRVVPGAEFRRTMGLGAPVAALLAGYLGAYLITQEDLAWHISASIARFAMQVWPASVWLALMSLRAPVTIFGDGRD